MIQSAAKPATSPTSAHLIDLSKIGWQELLTNGAIALLIVLIGYWLAKWLSRAIQRALIRAHVEPTLAGFLRNVSYAVMMVLVFVSALSSVGFNPTSLIAVLGAAGLGVGLALKDSLSNIASGVMLIMLRPFRDGDHVQAASLEGTVEEIRIFQTRIRTADNRLIILPNSMITTAPIINFTAKPQRRIDIAVTVRFQDDPNRAREIMLAIANTNPLVLKAPAPAVEIARLSDTGIDMTLLSWCKTKDLTEARTQLTEAVRRELLDSGMTLNAGKRDLHVYHHNADGTPLTELAASAIADDSDIPPPSKPVA
ncbi:MAG: mechanosensitive ion channel family protein [Pseudoxanthomonas sp.]